MDFIAVKDGGGPRDSPNYDINRLNLAPVKLPPPASIT